MLNWEVESELIAQSVTGDRAALSQLFLSHYDDLSKFIAARISPELQAIVRDEDILQQTFIHAAKSISSFVPEHAGSFRSWLRTIARNQLRDIQRHRRRERRGPGIAPIGNATDGKSQLEMVNQLADNQTPASRRVRMRESIRRMQFAVSHLPDDHREVIRRRYLCGESFDQIAKTMGSSKEAVRGICYRARKQLRANMGRSSQYFSS